MTSPNPSPPPSHAPSTGLAHLPAWLLCATALFSALGLVAELVHAFGPHNALTRALVPFLSLSGETNLPTWYAVCLLFSAALFLFANGQIPRPDGTSRFQWIALGVIFLYLSLDESAQIHEQLTPLFKTRGALYFGWIIPAGVAVCFFVLATIPFLRRLPKKTSLGFILSGALYVTGALFMEIPLGLWTEKHGSSNLTYGLIDWIEETLELVGASLFLVFLADYYTTTRIAAPRQKTHDNDRGTDTKDFTDNTDDHGSGTADDSETESTAS